MNSMDMEVVILHYKNQIVPLQYRQTSEGAHLFCKHPVFTERYQGDTIFILSLDMLTQGMEKNAPDYAFFKMIEENIALNSDL